MVTTSTHGGQSTRTLAANQVRSGSIMVNYMEMSAVFFSKSLGQSKSDRSDKRNAHINFGIQNHSFRTYELRLGTGLPRLHSSIRVRKECCPTVVGSILKMKAALKQQ